MYSPFRFLPFILSKPRPIHLTLFLTAKCNQKCPFCFYLRRESNDEIRRDELTLDEITKISKSMGSLLWLALSGGEIFLRKDLFEISKTFYDNNSPSIILYPTNGMMPDRITEEIGRIAGYCKESVIAVKLSIDGIGKRHDEIRNTDGAFDNVMESYESLAPLLAKYPNLELGINTVFTHSNQDYMADIIGFVKLLTKARTHTISLVRGDIKDPSHKAVDMQKYEEAIKLLEDGLKSGSSPVYRFKGASLKAAQDILQRRLIHKTMTEDRIQLPCYAGKLNIVISETGDVFPCETFSKKLGNIRDYNCSVPAILNNSKVKHEIDSIIKRGCFCTHECYFMTNILFNPRTYPALFWEYAGIKLRRHV